jgi:uncharacterized membrane protein
MKNLKDVNVPDLKTNVGFPERIISILSGSFLMCNALSSKGSFLKTLGAGYLIFRGTTGYCAGYDAAGKTLGLKSRNINIYTSITVDKPPKEVYTFWRKLDNLPLFMEHIEEVNTIDETNSEWKLEIPGGFGKVSWKSRIVEDVPNERLSWHSLPGSSIENAGNVQFIKSGRSGTELHVFISYRVPAGKIGEKVAKLFNPMFEEMVREDIKNFREFLEKGEI